MAAEANIIELTRDVASKSFQMILESVDRPFTLGDLIMKAERSDYPVAGLLRDLHRARADGVVRPTGERRWSDTPLGGDVLYEAAATTA